MRKEVLGIRITLLIVLVASLFSGGAKAQRNTRPFVIDETKRTVLFIRMPREGKIDNDLYEELRDKIQEAETMGPVAIVIDIDSGGGDAQAAIDISALVAQYVEHEDIRIYAWVPRRAISAAAWIAMACEGIFIDEDARFGDIQPIVGSWRGYERVPEKVLTDLTETVWLSARKNGIHPPYPRLFVEAMVDPDIEIVEAVNTRLDTSRFMRGEQFDALTEEDRRGLERHTVSARGRALTSNGRDLVKYGFAVRIVPDEHAILDAVGTHDAEKIEYQIKRSSPLGLDIDWSWLLLVAAIFFLISEFKTPGLGLFAVLSVLSFAGFFLVNSGFDDSAFIGVTLFVLGGFLLIVEVIILPGFGVAGISGIVLILYATYAAVASTVSDDLFPFPDFSVEDDQILLRNWAIILSVGIVGGVALTMTIGRFIVKIPILNRIMLIPKREEQRGQRYEFDHAALPEVGDVGTSETDLRPVGAARFGAQRLDVVSRGEFIKAGASVRVIEVAGNRIVVKTESGAES